MNKPQIESFATAQELDLQLAAEAESILGQAVTEKGTATLVVSGGSTPLNFFQLLSQRDLPWDRITVTLADERWVDPQHADSNERLLRERLLINNAAAARFLPLKNAAAEAAEGEAECESCLADLGCFDLLILGMGGDGHTASLFPGADNLEHGLDMDSGRACISMQPLTAPHQRMSMTLPRLLNAKLIVLHITGEAKQRIVREALEIEDQRVLPVSAVLQQQQTPIRIFWAP